MTKVAKEKDTSFESSTNLIFALQQCGFQFAWLIWLHVGFKICLSSNSFQNYRAGDTFLEHKSNTRCLLPLVPQPIKATCKWIARLERRCRLTHVNMVNAIQVDCGLKTPEAVCALKMEKSQTASNCISPTPLCCGNAILHSTANLAPPVWNRSFFWENWAVLQSIGQIKGSNVPKTDTIMNRKQAYANVIENKIRLASSDVHTHIIIYIYMY